MAFNTGIDSLRSGVGCWLRGKSKNAHVQHTTGSAHSHTHGVLSVGYICSSISRQPTRNEMARPLTVVPCLLAPQNTKKRVDQGIVCYPRESWKKMGIDLPFLTFSPGTIQLREEFDLSRALRERDSKEKTSKAGSQRWRTPLPTSSAMRAWRSLLNVHYL